MKKYKLIGWINEPSLWAINKDDAQYNVSIIDWGIIEDGGEDAIELLKEKYFVDGGYEWFNDNRVYVLDMDGDGIYLYKNVEE